MKAVYAATALFIIFSLISHAHGAGAESHLPATIREVEETNYINVPFFRATKEPKSCQNGAGSAVVDVMEHFRMYSRRDGKMFILHSDVWQNNERCGSSDPGDHMTVYSSSSMADSASALAEGVPVIYRALRRNAAASAAFDKIQSTPKRSGSSATFLVGYERFDRVCGGEVAWPAGTFIFFAGTEVKIGDGKKGAGKKSEELGAIQAALVVVQPEGALCRFKNKLTPGIVNMSSFGPKELPPSIEESEESAENVKKGASAVGPGFERPKSQSELLKEDPITFATTLPLQLPGYLFKDLQPRMAPVSVGMFASECGLTVGKLARRLFPNDILEVPKVPTGPLPTQAPGTLPIGSSGPPSSKPSGSRPTTTHAVIPHTHTHTHTHVTHTHTSGPRPTQPSSRPPPTELTRSPSTTQNTRGKIDGPTAPLPESSLPQATTRTNNEPSTPHFEAGTLPDADDTVLPTVTDEESDVSDSEIAEAVESEPVTVTAETSATQSTAGQEEGTTVPLAESTAPRQSTLPVKTVAQENTATFFIEASQELPQGTTQTAASSRVSTSSSEAVALDSENPIDASYFKDEVPATSAEEESDLSESEVTEPDEIEPVTVTVAPSATKTTAVEAKGTAVKLTEIAALQQGTLASTVAPQESTGIFFVQGFQERNTQAPSRTIQTTGSEAEGSMVPLLASTLTSTQETDKSNGIATEGSTVLPTTSIVFDTTGESAESDADGLGLGTAALASTTPEDIIGDPPSTQPAFPPSTGASQSEIMQPPGPSTVPIAEEPVDGVEVIFIDLGTNSPSVTTATTKPSEVKNLKDIVVLVNTDEKVGGTTAPPSTTKGQIVVQAGTDQIDSQPESA